MRVVVCKELGSLDHVIVEDRPTPEPEAGQVVVDVRAAGVNFVDGLMCEGRYQMKPTTPYVPGGEIAGVVSGVGSGVTQFEVGDRVMAMTGLGAFAEQVAVPELALVRIASSMSFGQAAAFVQSYCTAYMSLVLRGGLHAGEWVLVLGAGGGIGLASVDLACALGANVIAAASSDRKLAAARDMGAKFAISYEDQDLKTMAREISAGGVDVVVDPVGGRHAEPALRALGRMGRYLVIGFASGSIPTIPLNQVLLNNRSVIGIDWGAMAFGEQGFNSRLLAELMPMVEDGRLHPTLAAERPLEEAVSVMSGLLQRSVEGKVVLVP